MRIETEEALDKLVSRIKHKAETKPCRCLCIDHSSLLTEWDAVINQHRLLMGAARKFGDVSIAHILVPRKEEQPVADFTRIRLERVLSTFNALAWVTIFRWFWDDCAGVVDSIKLTSSEEYTLQAVFEDFRHEVFSIVLGQVMDELIAAVENGYVSEQQLDMRKRLEDEKTVVKRRDKLWDLAGEQRRLLDKMREGILIIEEKHRELLPIREAIEELTKTFDGSLSVNEMVRLGHHLRAVVVET